MAQIIYADGRIEMKEPANKKKFTLAELQGIVDGYIEIVRTKDGRLMVIDEEGKLKRSAVNETASDLYLYGGYDKIRGDVLVCTGSELE